VPTGPVSGGMSSTSTCGGPAAATSRSRRRPAGRGGRVGVHGPDPAWQAAPALPIRLGETAVVVGVRQRACGLPWRGRLHRSWRSPFPRGRCAAPARWEGVSADGGWSPPAARRPGAPDGGRVRPGRPRRAGRRCQAGAAIELVLTPPRWAPPPQAVPTRAWPSTPPRRRCRARRREPG
jgi:hypothetical protein